MPSSEASSVWRVLATLLTRHRLVAFGVGLFLTALAALPASKIELDSRARALLPNQAPSVLALDAVVDEVGRAGDALVVMEASPGEAFDTWVDEVEVAVQRLPWVRSTAQRPARTLLAADALSYVDPEDLYTVAERIDERLRWEKLQANPLFIDLEESEAPVLEFDDIEDKYRGEEKGGRGLYESLDGRVRILVVEPKPGTGSMGEAKRRQKELLEVVGPAPSPEQSIDVAGSYRNRLDEHDIIQRDIQSSGLFVAVCLLVLMVLYFRSLRSLLALFVPLAMAMIWTVAIAQLLLGALNTVSVFLVIVLMGLSLDVGIHMLRRFLAEIDEGHDIALATQLSVQGAGRSCAVAALTTAATMLVLLYTDFRGFADFGLLAGVGLLLAVASYLLVLPGLFSLLYGRSAGASTSSPSADARPSPVGRRVAHIVVGTFAFLLGFSYWVGRDASFEYDLRAIKSDRADSAALQDKVRSVFRRPRSPAAIVAPNRAAAHAIHDAIEERIAAGGSTLRIKEVLSSRSLLPDAIDERAEAFAELRPLVEEVWKLASDEERDELEPFRDKLARPQLTSLEDVPPAVRRSFTGREDTPEELVFVLQKGSLMDLRVARDFAASLEAVRVNGATYRAASEPLIYADIWRVLESDLPPILIAASIVLVLVLLLDLRSLGATVLVSLPLLLGLSMTFGIMFLFDIRLNLLNMIILPTVLGLGIDGGVHLYHRCRELGSQRIGLLMRETGSAVAVCTLSSIVGFGSMLLAEHPGLRSIGELAIVGLGSTLVATLIFFPALLYLLEIEKAES